MAGATASYNIWDNRGKPGGVCTIEISWLSDDATGGVTKEITELLTGRIAQLITDPDGVAAPTDDYDITLVSAKIPSFDLLCGCGVDRDTANQESLPVLDEITIGANTYADHPYVNEAKTTFTVANAGNAKAGKAWIIIE